MREHKHSRVPLDLRGLSAAEQIFRVAGGVRRDSAIEQWLNDEPIELRALARRWFEPMRQCGADVVELIHDGCPVACVRDAPFAYVNTFKRHVNVGFFYGATLDDPARLLEGSGKRMRHVKLNPTVEPNVAALRNLIDAAHVDIKARLRAERGTKEE